MNASVFGCARCGALYPERVAFCSSCGSFDSLTLQSSRSADSLWRQGGECLSALDLLKRSTSGLTSEAYPALRIGREAIVAIYGPPGAGKSTLLYKFLDGMPGDVLLLSIEEGFADTVIDRLKRLEIHRSDFHLGYVRSVEEIGDLVQKHNPVAVGIDSLTMTTLTTDDVMRLSSFIGGPLLFTLHVTKDGAPAGAMTVLHASDVVVRVEGMKWALEKSRFSGSITGEV